MESQRIVRGRRRGARLYPMAVIVGIGLGHTGRARAETRPAYGGAITASLLSEPVTIDPVAARTHAEVMLGSLIFDTLYRIDESGVAAPHVAAELPRLGERPLEVRIRLREGIGFHDGAALEVDDVVASLRRTAKSRSGWILAPVKKITSADGELVIELRRETPELPALLTATATAITPGGKAPSLRQANGSGPFRLASFSRSKRRAILAAAPRHFGGRPYLDRVELRWYERGDEEARLFESGKVELSLRGAVAFSGHQPKYATDEVEGAATVLSFVGFGKAHAAVTNHRDFRAALSLAIGRNGFGGIGSGERVVATLHPAALDSGGAATSREQRQVQVKAARAALRRAGREVTALAAVIARTDQLRLEIIIDSSRPDDREIAEKVVAALYRLGLAAKITALSATEFVARVGSGKCDLYVGQLAAPAPTAELATAAAFAIGGDRWAERALTRAPLDGAAAAREFAKRLPIVPLFHRALRVHHRSDVRGVAFDSISRLAFADVFMFGRPAAPAKGRRRSGP